MAKSFAFVSPHDCGDCEFLAFDTDGDFRICPECDAEGLQPAEMQEVEEDDGQPDWAQEWHDFDPEC